MLPTHSWDTVGGGVFWHSCNFSGAFTDASLEVMTRFPMVTVEKGQGLNESPAATAAETKIVAALRQVKEYAAAHDRTVATVFYYNRWAGAARAVLAAPATLAAVEMCRRS